MDFYDYDQDIINFQPRVPNFRQVLNQDSTIRYNRAPMQTGLPVQQEAQRVTPSTSRSDFYNQLMAAINPLLGEKYSNAKRLQKGFSDCSGFVNKVYKQLGKDLKGAGSMQLWQMGTNTNIDSLQPGDLAFLTASAGGKKVAGTNRRPGVDTTHVAIVLERQGTKIKVAESTGSQGTVIQWWEIGDPKKREKGVINYANGSGRRDRFFGFRRLL